MATKKIKKDYNTVLLEKLNHEFGIFGEGLTHVIGKVDGIADNIDVLKEDMKQVKTDVFVLKEDTKELKKDVGQLKGDVGQLRGDMLRSKAISM